MRAKVIRVVRADHNHQVFILLSDFVSFCVYAASLQKPQPSFFLEVGDEVEYEMKDGKFSIETVFFKQ